MFTQFSQ